MSGTGLRRPDGWGAAPPARVAGAFRLAAVFFAVVPLISLTTERPAPIAVAMFLAGWAIFAAVLGVAYLRNASVPIGGPWLGVAAAAIGLLGATLVVGFHAYVGNSLFYYAAITAARMASERRAMAGVAAVSLVAAASTAIGTGDPTAGVGLAVTVGTISLTIWTMLTLRRTNLALVAARRELADLAIVEERNRIARDLHDTLGHSLSMIALKSELARRVVADDPTRAAVEIADVERVAREMLGTVRETVGGYRQPSLAMELAGARAALAAAGIAGDVEPAPEGLPGEVDALLGWAVREGTTNVLRHSRASVARIRVLADQSATAVEVVDDGAGATDDRAHETGHGLVGLRERAARLGGTVEAGPLPERGFRLRVTIPASGGVPA